MILTSLKIKCQVSYAIEERMDQCNKFLKLNIQNFSYKEQMNTCQKTINLAIHTVKIADMILVYKFYNKIEYYV